MHNRCRTLARLALTAAVPVLLFASLAAAQTPARPAAAAARPAAPAQAPVYSAPAPTEKDVAATQTEMIKLLRLSPTLTTVVSHDPSLLSNQEYVNHNNPQLAEFLTRHPEVARNPEFYLFSHMNHGDGGSDEALERAVWPDIARERLYEAHPSMFQNFINDLPPLLGFACFLVALVWLVRFFLENRRWGRIFKMQSDVHGRLIEKFGTNQELALYMETEAGKKFLEAAPIPVGFEQQQQMPNAVARVLTPLQIGIVLSLLGAGLLSLRHASTEMDVPMLVLGTVVLMPGLGFIISAGVTWVLAARLGLMPENPAGSNRNELPYGSPNGSKDQQ